MTFQNNFIVLKSSLKEFVAGETLSKKINIHIKKFKTFQKKKKIIFLFENRRLLWEVHYRFANKKNALENTYEPFMSQHVMCSPR